MSARRVVAALTGLALLLVAAPSGAKTYRNKEYGFRVELPTGYESCLTRSGFHEVGIGVPLDGKPEDCEGGWDGPGMWASANYNAMFWTDLEPVRKWCNKENKGVVVPVPPGLVIPGQRTFVCRIDKADGSIAITLSALAVKRPPPRREPEDFTPMIEYHVSLRTRPERFDADLALFRTFLKSYRLFKPGG